MKRLPYLLDPAAGEGGGGALAPVVVPLEPKIDEGQAVFGKQPEKKAEPPAAPVVIPKKEEPTQAAPAFTPEVLAEALKAAGVGTGAAPAEPKKYTQEDFDKAFHVVRPNAEQLTKILAGGDEAVAALAELLQGAARQATVMSAFQMQELKDQLEARFGPVETEYKSKKEQAMFEEFLGENPGLKGMETVIKEVVAGLKARKVQFKDKKEAFAAVLSQTTSIIRSMPGLDKFDPAVKANAGADPLAPTLKPTMPTLSSGGSGGAGNGNGGGGDKSKSPGQSVFN